jgi:hypothetical protein
MNAQTKLRASSLLGCVLLLASLLPAQSQQSSGVSARTVPPAVQLQAAKMLQSPMVRYLSGPAHTLLMHLSGQITIPLMPVAPATQTVRSITASAPLLEKNQVMVNDPTQDSPEDFLFDISTQSETNVVGFRKNVVVVFNDSTEVFKTNGSSLMGYSVSTDGGETFADQGPFPSSPNGMNGGDPGLTVDEEGVIYASFLETDFSRPSGFESTIGISKSTDGGVTFSSPTLLPAAGVLPLSFQDKPFIAADNTNKRFRNNVYVAFDSSPNTPIIAPMPVLFSRSTDGGATFSTPIQINGPNEVASGAQPVVGPGGEVYVAWYRFLDLGDSTLPAGIEIARSNDGGVNFGAPVFVAAADLIGFAGGTMNGNFRVNSYPRMDVNQKNGHVYIVYAANLHNGDSGDVFFTRSTNGGGKWSVPLRVNDDATLNDQWFPAIAVNEDGLIEAVWYDKRNDPENVQLDVYSALSWNDGESFGPNRRVTPALQHPAVGFDPVVVPTYMGDYIDIRAVNVDGGRGDAFLLAWGDFRRIITTSNGTRPDQDVFFQRDH